MLGNTVPVTGRSDGTLVLVVYQRFTTLESDTNIPRMQGLEIFFIQSACLLFAVLYLAVCRSLSAGALADSPLCYGFTEVVRAWHSVCRSLAGCLLPSYPMVE